MHEDLIRPQDIEQVLFMGWNNFELIGYNDMLPTMGGEYYDIYAYDSKRWGFSIKNKTIQSIHKNRVCSQHITLGGKKTLVVFADVNVIDKNRSFLDLIFHSKEIEIENLARKNHFLNQQMSIYKIFIQEHGMEENFKERLQNMAEFIKVTSGKLSSKPGETPSVSVDVGSQDEKKK